MMQWRLLNLGPEEEPKPRGHVAGAEGALAEAGAGAVSVVAGVERVPCPNGHTPAEGCAEMS